MSIAPCNNAVVLLQILLLLSFGTHYMNSYTYNMAPIFMKGSTRILNLKRQQHQSKFLQVKRLFSSTIQPQSSSFLILHSSNNNNNDNVPVEYSREIVLREEAESPFRKIRFFFYASLGAAAATSLLISGTRVLAGLNGINNDLLDESIYNSIVDIVGIIVLSFLWQRDVMAQNSRYKRAAKGAELAKLLVKVSKSIVVNDDIDTDTSSISKDQQQQRFTTSLASLRRGRGIEKRVVIVVGNQQRIQSVLQEAQQINDVLQNNDLLITPIIIEPPNGKIIPLSSSNIISTTATNTGDGSAIDQFPDCIAIPVLSSNNSNGNWNMIITDEMNEAMKQNINVYDDGFCIVLKKNGRVGQRTRGIYLSNMVGDINQRREAGMDVVNI